MIATATFSGCPHGPGAEKRKYLPTGAPPNRPDRTEWTATAVHDEDRAEGTCDLGADQHRPRAERHHVQIAARRGVFQKPRRSTRMLVEIRGSPFGQQCPGMAKGAFACRRPVQPEIL